ncbi:hypothetical protein AKJ52_01690, partial [candidate division MSBL1 archaeon SCGC-AAA382C18]
ECKDWTEIMEIHELDDPPTCPKCGSGKIGMVEKELRSVRRTLDRVKNGSTKEKKSEIWKTLDKSSRLVSDYGKAAAVAMAGNGISPSMAQDILEEKAEISDKFLDLVIEKERKSLFSKYE